MIHILIIGILFIPTLWKLWKNRKGTKHPNNELAIVILLITAITNLVGIFPIKINLVICMLLSASMFISLFPYLINIVLYRNRIINDPKWWSYLSKGHAWPDDQKWWEDMDWQLRMLIQFIPLLFSVLLYIKGDFSYLQMLINYITK